ncbi:MAG: YfhO family protein, partial [Verrucomicrobiales bacterium]|jgi:hypothetical protein|nr:YfhO family protein [Verrucomicrobiales bacterium]
VILFLLTGVFFADLFLGGKTFLLRDGYFIVAKAEAYGWQAVAGGDFPFWDSQGMGKPFLESPPAFFFYPPGVLFGLFRMGWAVNVFCFLNVWLVGLGVWFFARQMRVEQVPSLSAAVSVMFGTFVMAYLEFLIGLAALPWIFFILGVLARYYHLAAGDEGKLLAGIWRQRALLGALALLFAVHFFSYYQEFFVYSFIGYGLFITLAAVGERSWKLFWSMTLFVGAAGVMAVLLVMPQLALLWNFLPFTERAAAFDARFDMASLSAAHLLKAALPMIGGRPGFPDVYWSPGTFEFCIGTFYTGALALLALPFAFLRRWRERGRTERLLVMWGAVLMVFGLLIAFGHNTPVYPLLWKYVPMMNKLRFASKFLLLVTIGEAALIAVGVRHLLQMSLTKRAVAVLWAEGMALACLGLLLLAVMVDPSLMPAIFGYAGAPIPDDKLTAVMPSLAWSYVFLLLAFGWILWVLRRGAGRVAAALAVGMAFVNLWVLSRPIQPTAPVGIYDRVPEVTRRAADSRFRAFSWYENAHQYLYADPRADIYEWAMEAGVNAGWYPYSNVQIMCQNGIKLQKYNVWMSKIYGENPAARDNFFDAAGVRWVVGGAPWQRILWGKERRELSLTERAAAIPRFHLYTAWQLVADDDAALKYLATADNELLHHAPAVEETALFNGRLTRLSLPTSPAGTNTPGALTLTREGNSRLEFTVSGGEVPRLLTVSDAWYPGWRAFVDGEEVPIYRANYMFRGIVVPAGGHTVRFDYWPVNFGWYLAAAALGLVMVSVLLLGWAGWKKIESR